MMLMRRRRRMMMLRRSMLRRKTDPKTRKHTLCEPAQATCAWTFDKSHFVWKCTGKMAGDTSWDIVLCEPAQSKCTWTFHKSHFVWKFIWKMPNAPDTTSIEHRALTLTVRTPQCGHTVWGKLGVKKSMTESCYCYRKKREQHIAAILDRPKKKKRTKNRMPIPD